MSGPAVCGVPDQEPAAEPAAAVGALSIERLHELSGILAPWSRYVVGPLDAEDLRHLVAAEIERREAQGGST